MNSIKTSSVLLSCLVLYASAVPVPDVLKPEDQIKLGTKIEMQGNGAKNQEAYAKFPGGSSISVFNTDIPGKAAINGEKGTYRFQGDNSKLDLSAMHERIHDKVYDFKFDKYSGGGKFQHDNGILAYGDVSHIPKLDTTSYNAGAGYNLWTSPDKKGTLDWTVGKSYQTSPFGSSGDTNTFLKFGYNGF